MNLSTLLAIIVLGIFSIFQMGCSSYRPILDENDTYLRNGSQQAEKDIDECVAKAERYLEQHKKDRMAKSAGRGAATGAILGGVLGAITGGGLRSAVGGAAVGGVVGAGAGAGKEAAKDNLSPDEMKNNYVTRCLNRKNYDVIGWK